MIPQHCASLLHTIFASFARSNERVYLHSERNFPQAKLDNEINARPKSKEVHTLPYRPYSQSNPGLRYFRTLPVWSWNFSRVVKSCDVNSPSGLTHISLWPEINKQRQVHIFSFKSIVAYHLQKHLVTSSPQQPMDILRLPTIHHWKRLSDLLVSKLSFLWYLRSIMRNITMKQEEKKKKQTNRRQTLDRLCSGSGLLLSVVCCIALIHVELRIQEHHRLISHSVTFCDKMETEILRKVRQNYRRWQVKTDAPSHGTKGWFSFEIVLQWSVSLSYVIGSSRPFYRSVHL